MGTYSSWLPLDDAVGMSFPLQLSICHLSGHHPSTPEGTSPALSAGKTDGAEIRGLDDQELHSHVPHLPRVFSSPGVWFGPTWFHHLP